MYDVHRQSSFHFIKLLRENILQVRRHSNDFQFIVAANMMDKLKQDVSKQNKNIQENINLVRDTITNIYHSTEKETFQEQI